MQQDDAEKILRYFKEGSPLLDAPKYGGQKFEFRDEQLALATAITASLDAGTHLCAEAPTGIGKSFAYLIPAVYRAKRTGKPVVISTNTIALQEQLMERDIPVLQQLLDTPFTAALAKGRENYLCVRRLTQACNNRDEYLPFKNLESEIDRIAEWAQDTSDGSRSDLDFIPGAQSWSVVCSESGSCDNDKDGSQGTCFLARARKRLYSADVIIANHALFCVDLATRSDPNIAQALLPDYDAVIIDEAHSFEDVAATHLGFRVSSQGIHFALNRLYNPVGKRGLLARADRSSVRDIVIRLRDAVDRFMAQLRDWLAAQHVEPVVYDTPGHIPNPLSLLFGQLESELELLAEGAEDDRDYQSEISNLKGRIRYIRESLDTFLQMGRDGCVYWFESSGQDFKHIVFNAVPINVQPILKELLFDRDFPVILTSATLAYNHDLSYFKSRVGADDADGIIFDSPFDFEHQMDLYVPFSSMPNPNESDLFLTAACEQIKHFIIKSGGKAFVLFTSYSMMNRAHEELTTFFEDNGLRVLLQGQEMSRNKLLQEFRRDVESVLFGTDSFWNGVDVPGEALSNVIIVKLPFAVPTHPLVAARKAEVERQSGNAFRNYFLPEAVLKFRQGVGRLIRSKTDHGIVVVLDPRIVKTNYGKVFLGAIPECRRHIF